MRVYKFLLKVAICGVIGKVIGKRVVTTRGNSVDGFGPIIDKDKYEKVLSMIATDLQDKDFCEAIGDEACSILQLELDINTPFTKLTPLVVLGRFILDDELYHEDLNDDARLLYSFNRYNLFQLKRKTLLLNYLDDL
jgi:hypothetical protein